MRPPTPPERLTLDIERLTFGPDALAHYHGQVVFVAHGAPGDRVEAVVTAQRPDYLRARTDRVLAPGPARVLPGCAAFPRCGGCPWQHVAPEAQRGAKAAIVAEQLARLAALRDVPVGPVLAAGDWAYRARITLAVEGRRAGYHQARSHALVEIADCPVAAPAVAGHLAAARQWVAALRVPLARVSIAAAPGGVVLVGSARARPGARDLDASEALLARQGSVRGVVLQGGAARLEIGDVRVRIVLEPGLDLEVPADVFTQVNPEANARLVDVVAAMAAVTPDTRVLDLYCGAGNFALPLARRGAVVLGVERSALAVAAATANAARHRLGRATFAAQEVARALAARRPGDTDVVVLDPPRAGAAGVIDAIAALRAPAVVYVSCDPATLARDVAAFRPRGYRLAHVQPVDLFPQTHHVECVALLRLT